MSIIKILGKGNFQKMNRNFKFLGYSLILIAFCFLGFKIYEEIDKNEDGMENIPFIQGQTSVYIKEGNQINYFLNKKYKNPIFYNNISLSIKNKNIGMLYDPIENYDDININKEDIIKNIKNDEITKGYLNINKNSGIGINILKNNIKNSEKKNNILLINNNKNALFKDSDIGKYILNKIGKENEIFYLYINNNKIDIIIGEKQIKKNK